MGSRGLPESVATRVVPHRERADTLVRALEVCPVALEMAAAMQGGRTLGRTWGAARPASGAIRAVREPGGLMRAQRELRREQRELMRELEAMRAF